MSASELTKKLTIKCPDGTLKTISLYDDYTKFDKFDSGNYIAVQISPTQTGYIYCDSVLPVGESDQFATFIDKNNAERYAYTKEQMGDGKKLVARYYTKSVGTGYSKPIPYFYPSTWEYECVETSIKNGLMFEIYSVDGTLPTKINFNRGTNTKQYVTSVDYLDLSNATNGSDLFDSCKYLTSINTDNIIGDSGLETWSNAFKSLDRLTSLDLKKIDFSSATHLTSLLQFCKLTSIDISDMSFPKVVSTENMFNSSSNVTIIDMRNVQMPNNKIMTSMFSGCPNLTTIYGIESLDVSKVTNMEYLISSCSSLKELNLSGWTTPNLKTFARGFMCSNLEMLDIRNFDTRNLNYDGCLYAFNSVPSTCKIYVGANFTKTESECDFSGKFIHV